MRLWRWIPVPLLALAAMAVADGPADKPKEGPADGTGELLAPVRMEVNGKPIDTAVGHAAPFVGDFDGDGVRDLLVGQFGDGILWVYKNVGSNAAPKLAAGIKFKDGTQDGRVPTG
jgi:hypothetical protein